MTTPTTDIHSCSHLCTRPDCIKRERDELLEEVERLRAILAESISVFDGETIDEIELEYGRGTAQRIQNIRAALGLTQSKKGVNK